MAENFFEKSARVVIDNIKTRSSCRVFLDEPVPRDIMVTLLDAANYAPSPMNTQPWEFIVLGGEPLARFREVVAEWLQTPNKKETDEKRIVPNGDFYTSLPGHLVQRKKEHLQRTSRQLAEWGLALKDVYPATYFCYNAPAVIMVIGDAVKRDRHGLEIHQGLAAAIQNILLAAHALGYGTCWIGDIMRFGGRLHNHLGIGQLKEVVGAVALGRPDNNSALNQTRAPKRPVNSEWQV